MPPRLLLRLHRVGAIALTYFAIFYVLVNSAGAAHRSPIEAFAPTTAPGPTDAVAAMAAAASTHAVE